ncbi:MAG TPA: T9SS type A sorting domain-containing protein [Bacteroidetes bacterium]|nr:T9SS type A sorting domain-containing protein [Bacteroidota bacterium]
MKSNIFILLIGGLALYCQSYSQTCNYLAYEPFDFASGTALHNYSGGSGWEENWLVQNNDTTLPGYQFENNNLIYGDLQTVGNKAAAGANYLTAGRKLDLSAGGPFSAYINSAGHIGKDSTTLWFSVLLQKNNNNSSPAFVELNSNPVGWVINNSGPHIGVGYYGANSEVGGQKRWSLRIGGTVYPTTEAVVFGTPILAVISVYFNSTGGHEINLYINPVLGNMPPAISTLNQNYTGSLYFQSLAIYGETPGENNYDEIRYAGSFRCVAPDAGVPVNLPPTAVITASATEGMAPLSIGLNAANSSDPNGSIVLYEWDFGDGSGIFTQISPTAFTHVFNNLGILNISLKVTDNDGSTHLATQEIIVRNIAGTFPCLSGAGLTPATCGNNDGGIHINTWNGLVDSHILINSNGDTLSDDGNNNYNNLPPGGYNLFISGTYGCSDNYQLNVVVDSSTCAGWSPEICRMDFGMNLNFPNYFSTERPFKNLFRFNSGFYTVDAAMPWVPTGQYNSMPKDADGYPLEVPWTNASGTHLVKTVLSDNGYYPQERLVVLYDGEGDLQCTEPMENISPGRFETIVGNTGQILLEINSSLAGNHIRNIRILRMGDEFDDLIAAPFHDTFLVRLQAFKAIRFMNWMRTNNSTMTEWDQRTLPNFYNQSDENTGGVAYESIIQLCNILQKDAWVCIPHQVDENYIVQLGQLFNSSLDPNLNVYIEYSNEVWNWGFSQAFYVTDNGPKNISYPRRYTERAINAMNIFRNQFGGSAARVKRVLGTQLTHNWVTHEILGHAAPNDYEYISPSAYFGWAGGSCESSLNASSTALDVINCTRTTFLEQMPSWREDYFNAKMYGKEIVNYESGNHMTNFNNSVPFAQAIRDAQTHPEIYNLYQEVIDSLRKFDCRLSMYFVLASRLGNSVDVFGHLDDIDQAGPFMNTAPKYQVLLDNIEDCEKSTALPVEFTELYAWAKNGKTRLTWATFSEYQNEGFEVEKSEDGIFWENIGFVAGNGNSDNYRAYKFWDKKPFPGINYYRLKQWDFNGRFHFSNVASVVFDGGLNNINIYPNPARSEIYMSENISGEVFIFNSLGQKVFYKNMETENSLDISGLPEGQYWLQILNGGNNLFYKKIIKQ